MSGDNNFRYSINEKKLNRIQMEIYNLERENLKKNPPSSDSEMIEKIRKKIEEVIKKCY